MQRYIISNGTAGAVADVEEGSINIDMIEASGVELIDDCFEISLFSSRKKNKSCYLYIEGDAEEALSRADEYFLPSKAREFIASNPSRKMGGSAYVYQMSGEKLREDLLFQFFKALRPSVSNNIIFIKED